MCMKHSHNNSFCFNLFSFSLYFKKLYGQFSFFTHTFSSLNRNNVHEKYIFNCFKCKSIVTTVVTEVCLLCSDTLIRIDFLRLCLFHLFFINKACQKIECLKYKSIVTTCLIFLEGAKYYFSVKCIIRGDDGSTHFHMVASLSIWSLS